MKIRVVKSIQNMQKGHTSGRPLLTKRTKRILVKKVGVIMCVNLPVFKIGL